MTATEAIVYCLGYKCDVLEDGAYHSATAYDCDGNPHWIAWANGIPWFCSETSYPFSEKLEPYRT